MLSATVKRANNTASNTLVVMILWFVLTPIAILYLLFAPARVIDNAGEAKKQMSLVGVIAVIFLAVIALGLVSAVVSKLDKSQNIEQKAPKISKTTPNP
jgi:heme/copper-type cytochrome/quinol oxidase subunit 2